MTIKLRYYSVSLSTHPHIYARPHIHTHRESFSTRSLYHYPYTHPISDGENILRVLVVSRFIIIHFLTAQHGLYPAIVRRHVIVGSSLCEHTRLFPLSSKVNISHTQALHDCIGRASSGPDTEMQTTTDSWWKTFPTLILAAAAANYTVDISDTSLLRFCGFSW